MERRLIWLAGAIVLWGAVALSKIVSLQWLHHAEYARLARSHQELVIEIPAPRGTIFDRSGAPLAMSVPTESVYINPRKVPDLGMAAEILSMVLKLDRTELYGKMKLAADNHRGFLWIKRRLSPEEARSLRNLRLEWIDIQTESQRHYPGGTLAAHVLGGVDFEERGNAGIEKTLDDVLRGQPGRARLLADVKGRGIDQQLSSEARAGTPITLTIEERLQYVAEREIAAAVIKNQAASGSIVAMNPYDGEIYAMASYPTYDPNVPPQPGEDLASRQNHAASVPFEPGSVFKVITLSAALETTNLRPESPIDCHGGVLRLPGRVIHDSHAGLGVIPMAAVLAKSSNIGAIEVGMRVGQTNMFGYMRGFGFGQKTGIQLPAESAGKLRKLAHWGRTSLASVSMGQEVSVTTVQLAQAGSVIANGGLLVKPRLLLKRGDQAVQPAPAVRVIKPETAITMRQMMEGVVMPGGTGTRARLEGYSVGGKTGSAQIFDFLSRHYTHTYNGSFVGFAPLTNPAIVVVVTLNGTHGTAGFGGAAAAPVFHTVATEALRILDVPRDLPDEEPPPAREVARNSDDVNDLAIADLGSDQPNILEDDEDDDQPPAGPKAPNFRGMTMRAVLAEAARQGLAVIADGSGTARAQIPPPGSALHEGERIRVRFAR
jgi:cell division protein FtsI (penicillin-binding protein 3)